MPERWELEVEKGFLLLSSKAERQRVSLYPVSPCLSLRRAVSKYLETSAYQCSQVRLCPFLIYTPLLSPFLHSPPPLSSPLSLCPPHLPLCPHPHFSHSPASTAAVSPDLPVFVSPKFVPSSSPLSLSPFALASSSPALLSQTRGTRSSLLIALPASSPAVASQQTYPPATSSSLGTDATATEEREPKLLIVCPRQTRDFHPSFLQEIDRVGRELRVSVSVHQVKNNVIWGLRMAKNRALLSGRFLSSPLSPLLTMWVWGVLCFPMFYLSRCYQEERFDNMD